MHVHTSMQGHGLGGARGGMDAATATPLCLRTASTLARDVLGSFHKHNVMLCNKTFSFFFHTIECNNTIFE